jgi:hypothetical protein
MTKDPSSSDWELGLDSAGSWTQLIAMLWKHNLLVNVFVCSFLKSHKVWMWLRENPSFSRTSSLFSLPLHQSSPSFTSCAFSLLSLGPCLISKELGFWSYPALDLTRVMVFPSLMWGWETLPLVGCWSLQVLVGVQTVYVKSTCRSPSPQQLCFWLVMLWVCQHTCKWHAGHHNSSKRLGITQISISKWLMK